MIFRKREPKRGRWFCYELYLTTPDFCPGQAQGNELADGLAGQAEIHGRVIMDKEDIEKVVFGQAVGV